MPQNLERDFLEFVRKRNQKRRKLIAQRIGAFLLIAILVLGVAYSLGKSTFILGLGNLGNNLIVLFLSIFGLGLILGLVVYAIKHRAESKWYKSFANFLNLTNFKRVNPKHLVGFSLLIIAMILQANPSLMNKPFNDLLTHWKYNPTPPISNSFWPWKTHKTIHPAVASMTSDIEKSIKSVAEYIIKQEPEPYLQIKALHDYVISRVTYDLDVLKTGRRPPQDAQTVFSTHKAVCEGYANLFQALGRAVGIEVVSIRGKIRQDLAPVDLIPETLRLLKSNYDWTHHAWNAVKVEGNWQLVDTTWDDGNSNDSTSSYRANYLMPPPQAMIMSHFPEQQDWQLLHSPKSYSYFEKQPILTPQFFAEELTIVSPTEYQTKIQKTALIEIKSPPNYLKKVVAIFSRRKESKFPLWGLSPSNPFTQEKIPDVELCQSQHNVGGTIQISCQFPEPGDYQVFIFSLEQQNHFFRKEISPIGQLRFHSLKAGD